MYMSNERSHGHNSQLAYVRLTSAGLIVIRPISYHSTYRLYKEQLYFERCIINYQKTSGQNRKI